MMRDRARSWRRGLEEAEAGRRGVRGVRSEGFWGQINEDGAVVGVGVWQCMWRQLPIEAIHPTQLHHNPLVPPESTLDRHLPQPAAYLPYFSLLPCSRASPTV